MSKTYDILMADMKSAMKNGDVVARDCIRGIISDVKNQTVNAGKEITDDVCIKALQKSVKTHNDSIAQFTAAGRNDLVSKEKAELEVLNKYLPKMLSDEEVEVIVKSIISQMSADKQLTTKDMGRVMKAISSHENAASIDKKVASKLVASMLA